MTLLAVGTLRRRDDCVADDARLRPRRVAAHVDKMPEMSIINTVTQSERGVLFLEPPHGKSNSICAQERPDLYGRQPRRLCDSKRRFPVQVGALCALWGCATMQDMMAVQENAEWWLERKPHALGSWQIRLDAWQAFKKYRAESPQIRDAYISLSLHRMRLRREVWLQRWLERSDHVRKTKEEFDSVGRAHWPTLVERYGCKCAACGAGTEATLGIDHIKAVTRGGTNDLDNLQILCRSCNSRKQTKTIDYRDSAT